MLLTLVFTHALFSQGVLPLRIVSEHRVPSPATEEDVAFIAGQARGCRITLDDKGESAFCWDGAVWDLKSGNVRRGLTPLVVRHVDTRNWLPVLESNAEAAIKRLGPGASTFGRVSDVFRFDGKKIVVWLDGAELPPGETERERALVLGLTVIAAFDLRSNATERPQVICAWTKSPGGVWVSPQFKVIVLGKNGVSQFPRRPPKGRKDYTSLEPLERSAAAQFKGLSQPAIRRIYAISRDGRRALVTKGVSFGEIDAKTGSFASVEVDHLERTRVRYLGGQLCYSGATGDTVFWRRDLKKWVPGPGGRLAGASVDGTWLLLKDGNGYRRLQVKWR